MGIGWREWRTMAVLSLVVTSAAYPCTRTTPVSTTEMLTNADAIVRAKAVGPVRPGSPPASPADHGVLRFDVLEVVKGDRELTTVVLPGHLIDRDDFNDQSPPHQVRPSGRSGSCYTDEYRVGGEYLLVLKKSTDGTLWTTRWYPLGPVNEQLTGPDDPWLEWVRANLK